MLCEGPWQAEIQREIYKGSGGPEVKFYLNYVLGSGFLSSHRPGGRGQNVTITVLIDATALGHFHHGSCLRCLCSPALAFPRKFNNNDDDGKSADTTIIVPGEKT